jgi:hypothetical protein
MTIITQVYYRPTRNMRLQSICPYAMFLYMPIAISRLVLSIPLFLLALGHAVYGLYNL